MKSISSTALKEKLDQASSSKSAVIDVRTPEEFAQGHIVDALNIPVQDLPHQLEELQNYDTLYINCRSGGRSQKGCQYLMQHGFDDVINLEGGLLAWEKAGLPITKETA